MHMQTRTGCEDTCCTDEALVTLQKYDVELTLKNNMPCTIGSTILHL